MRRDAPRAAKLHLHTLREKASANFPRRKNVVTSCKPGRCSAVVIIPKYSLKNFLQIAYIKELYPQRDSVKEGRRVLPRHRSWKDTAMATIPDSLASRF